MTSENNQIGELPTLSEGIKDISEEKILQAASNEVKKGYTRLKPQIDAMSSASLKRVLKTVTHVAVAEHLITGEETTLNGEEQKLVDSLYLHMENTISFLEVMNQHNKGETK